GADGWGGGGAQPRRRRARGGGGVGNHMKATSAVRDGPRFGRWRAVPVRRHTRRRGTALLALAVCLCSASSASACEPIIPLMMVLGGPGFLAQSVVVLAAAVTAKCVLFALLQRPLSRPRA